MDNHFETSLLETILKSTVLHGITKHKNRLKLSYRGFFSKETSWAGRSAWYDRHVGIVEVPGSNPGPSTRTFFETEDSARSLDR